MTTTRRNPLARAAAAVLGAVFALAFLPALPAYGLSADTVFDVDGVLYKAYAAYNTRADGSRLQVVHVSGLSYDGADAVAVESGVLEIPDTVDYDGTTYDVMAIDAKAFNGCTELSDLRVGDLGTGSIYSNAFTGCTGLKVIHVLGDGWVNRQTAGGGSFTDVPAGLKFVLHDPARTTASLITSSSFGAGSYPEGTTVYHAVAFQQGSAATTAYVRCAVIAAGSSSTGINNNVALEYVHVPADLAALGEDELYLDAGSSKPLCTHSVPKLAEGFDAWSVTSVGERLDPDASLVGGGVAVCVKSTDLGSATAHTDAASLRSTGGPLDPKAYVVDALGREIDSEKLERSYFAGESSSAGAAVGADGVVEPGIYTVRFTPAPGSGLTGACETAFEVKSGATSWTRLTGADRHTKAQALASSFSTFVYNVDNKSGELDGLIGQYGGGYTYIPSITLNKRFRVLVNPNDEAACLVGASLAGVLGCPVLTTDAKSLPRSTAVQLAGASNATVIVVGSAKSVGDAVKTAAGAYGRGSARVDGTTPAELAAAAEAFVAQALSGEYASIAIEEGYSDAALVVPADFDASAFAAAAWCVHERAHLVFASGAGGEADLSALPDVSHVVVAGPETVAVQGVAEGARVERWGASAPAGASGAYARSAAYTQGAVDDGALSYYQTLLVTPSDCGVLAAAAVSCGLSGSAMLLSDATAAGAFCRDALAQEHAGYVSYGILCMGYDEFSGADFEEFARAWDEPDPANMRFATATAGDVTATGKALAVKVKVTASDGTALKQGTDYTVSYIDNATGSTVPAAQLVNPGSYTAVCTGTRASVNRRGAAPGDTDQYTGTYYNARSAVFSVKAPAKPAKPSGLKLSAGKGSLKASWSKAARAKSYQLAYRAKGAKAWKAKAAASAKLSLKGLKKGKSYQVRVRAKGVSGWGAWSAVKTSKKVK